MVYWKKCYEDLCVSIVVPFFVLDFHFHPLNLMMIVPLALFCLCLKLLMKLKLSSQKREIIIPLFNSRTLLMTLLEEVLTLGYRRTAAGLLLKYDTITEKLI